MAVLVIPIDCAVSVSLGTDGTAATAATSMASPPTTNSVTESPVATTTPTTSPPSTTATVTPIAAPTESSTSEPIATFTPAPGYGPWGSEPVVASVAASDGGRDYVTFANEATAFWKGNDSRCLEYEIGYEVDADARGPDLVVRFTNDIPVCSGLDDAADCAPYLTDGWRIDRPKTVYVRIGHGDDLTVDIVAHEPGHALRLTHDDEPTDLVNAASILYTLPRINATKKVFPWDGPNFTARIDDTNTSDPGAVHEQVHHALDYFEDDASGMPDNLTYTYVGDPTDTEMHTFFADSSPCTAGAAFCAIAGGYDPDGDDASETCGSYRAVLIDFDTEAVGWHAGYWTAHYLGTEADDDKPEPFRNTTYGERRSEWWAQHRRRVVSRTLCVADGGFHPDESVEFFFDMAPVERIMTLIDRYDDTHPTFDRESLCDTLVELSGTDAERRIIMRQTRGLAGSGQAETDRDAPLMGDEVVRNMHDAPDGDPATRWNQWFGALEAAYGGYREFQVRRIPKA